MYLGLSILSRPDWKLRDFDQVFYVTIAYDLDRYGVFSDGIFDPVDSSVQPAQPGMFFGPVFPAMILAVMNLDQRFAEAVRCSVDSNRGHRDESTCEAYETPIRILNAALLAIGVAVVGLAAELIFRRTRWIFLFAGLFATAALASEAHIFSFVMTESAIFAFYSVFAWTLLRALIAPVAGQVRHRRRRARTVMPDEAIVYRAVSNHDRDRCLFRLQDRKTFAKSYRRSFTDVCRRFCMHNRAMDGA